MRFSSSTRLWSAAACSVASGLTLGSATASAQGFLDFLFGGGPSYPQQSQQHLGPQGITTPGGKPYQFPSSAPSRGSDDDSRNISNYGSYKTICVRTCDGYYFPISSSTTRKGFARDEARCQASCGGGARLFHVPANQSTVDGAVDDDGRAYAAMKTAFLYRKQKVEGCQCHNAPWSETELSRHRTYAETEEAAKMRQQPQSEPAKVATDTAQPVTPEHSPTKSASQVSPQKMRQSKDSRSASASEGSETALASSPKSEVVIARAAPAVVPATTEETDPKPVAEAEPPKRAASKTATRSRPASDRNAAKTGHIYAKPPQGQGPVAIKVAAPAKAPSLGNPMGLGGGALQWPGDAPPAQPYPRKRYQN